MKFTAWLRQPTTIMGLASAGGLLLGLLAQVLTGNTTLAAATGAATFSMVNMVVNDNTVAKDAAALAQTGVTMAMGGPAAETTLAPTMATEAFALIRDLTTGKLVPALAPPVAAAELVSSAGTIAAKAGA